MKNYSIIDKEINNYRSGKNKNEDIFLLGYIKACCTDYSTGESHVTQEKLCDLTKIPLRTIQSIISRLKMSSLINVETRQIGLKRLNIYRFNLQPTNFFFVSNRFYYTDIEQREKGLLLLIKSLCINNSNATLYNRTKIAELIGQDRSTVSKMINNLVDKNMLLELKQGFQLPANFFPIYENAKKTKDAYEYFNAYFDFILNSILDFCIERGTILFTSDLFPLKLISAHYPFLNKDFENVNDEDFIKTHYMPEILKKRCPTLPPKIESLNYFLEVLNIEYKESNPCPKEIYI
jgi:hypothetical protein